MPLEVALPMMGNNKKTVKDHIINILTYEWPLSARKLYNILQKRYTLNMSYQAVHKAVKELLEQKIIVNSADGYQLDMEWVKGVKDFSDKIENHYKNNHKIDVSGSNSNFNFDNLRDYYLFMLDLLNRASEGADDLYQIAHHLYFPISLTKEEYLKFTKMLTKFKKSYTICKNSSDADNLIQLHHKSINPEHGIVLGADCADDSEIFVANDIVVQSFLAEELKSALDTVYENSKTTEELKKNLDPLMKKKFKIHVVMNKNQQLAENIKNRVKGHFNGKRKKNGKKTIHSDIPLHLQKFMGNHTFENLYDLYMFVIDYFDTVSSVCDKDITVSQLSHLYWNVVASDEIYKKFGNMLNKYEKMYIAIRGNTPADNFLINFYTHFKKDIIIKLGLDCAKDFDFSIDGDYILQMFFPEELKKKIDDMFENFDIKSTDKLSEIYENLFKTKAKIHVIITKNSDIAREFQNKTIALFDEKDGEKDQNEFISQVLTFQTIHETEKFLMETARSIIENIEENKKENPFLGIYWQHFWVPILLSIDTYKEMLNVLNYFDVYSTSRHETIVDKWCFKFYEKTDLNVKIGVEMGDIDFVVFGDIVFQIFYPEELKKEIYNNFSSIKNIDEFDLKQFFDDVFEKKANILVLISKNEQLAEYFKRKILSNFNCSKNFKINQ